MACYAGDAGEAGEPAAATTTTVAAASTAATPASKEDKSSAGDDLFRTYANRVVMTGAGFLNWAGDFERNTGYASVGNDSARMFDSNGDDVVMAESWGAILSHESGRNFQAREFDLIDAWSINGGDDTAFDQHIGYVFRLRGNGW